MCEDFPCCGHEAGDCNGQKYGSDESIMSDPHLLCDHEFGSCEVEDEPDDWDGDDGLSDAEADAMTLASAGWGTDEDYGFYGYGEDY